VAARRDTVAEPPFSHAQSRVRRDDTTSHALTSAALTPTLTPAPNRLTDVLLAMKVTYDADVDVLRILFNNAPIEESDEEKPGVILDYDGEGNIVGLEILDASQRVENPRDLEYAVTGA
jgi:uncharacterized protein YuzE